MSVKTAKAKSLLKEKGAPFQVKLKKWIAHEMRKSSWRHLTRVINSKIRLACSIGDMGVRITHSSYGCEPLVVFGISLTVYYEAEDYRQALLSFKKKGYSVKEIAEGSEYHFDISWED